MADRQYWLMKSEPDVYSIDDLESDGETMWDGVRNYQARNFMRDDMEVGDRVLFYHSNASPPGVVGVAEVSRAGYPDHTARDPDSNYYDEKATEDDPRWFMVDVEFVEAFDEVVSLEEIKAMEAQREFATLVCPGFFTDEGTWTGVRVTDLLERAGVRPGADQLKFVAADGKYSANLKIAEVKGEGMLIAYAFEDKPLAKVHGYPLRVVARDQPGNRWVKWLGEIVVQ